ncbi:MAG: SPOR domain-containing protein [Croceibacterium sp.]
MTVPGKWSGAAHRGARAALAASLLLSAPVMAQVQPSHAADTARLNEALRTLARSPQSVDALIAAGEASLKLEDISGALGFLRRAETINGQDPRVKAGLASVLVRQRQPLEALRLFTEASQAGALSLIHVADRGLAYDLIGDNRRAQQDYAVALAAGADSVVSRRLALSQAIAGDQASSDATLLPLLQRKDLAAYRTRAFALAIVGRGEEAVSIAETMLPASLSGRMAPYLRYMPRLTRAQQAAAANLGAFPRPEEIGRDDPALAAYAASIGVPAGAASGVRSADARLAPSGPPMGRAAPPQVAVAAPRVRAAISPSAAPAPAVSAPAPSAPAPALPERARAMLEQHRQPAAAAPAASNQLASVTASQQASLAPVAVPPPPVAASLPAETTPGQPPAARAPVVVATLEPPAGVSAALTPAKPVVVATLEPTGPPDDKPAAPPQPVTRAASLSQAFADLAAPRSAPPVAAPGAVDITARRPARPQTAAKPPAKPAAPPKPPPVPSRQWVQLATGRDPKALAFDWRRLKREGGALLDKQSPSMADWGQTNRLVVGPFATAAAADTLVGKLKDRKIDAFRFTSAAGEAVTPLD